MAVTINGSTGIETNTDTGKVKVGASDDIQIYHESGSSYITNLTGNTFVKTLGGQFHVRPNGDEEGLIVKPNGAVELYNDNELKLSTTASGLQVKDTSEVTTWIGLETSGGTCGYLVGQSNAGSGSDKAVSLYNAAGNETLLRGITDGAVELYYNNVKTFQTTTAGVEIRGPQGGSADLWFSADEGDDNNDKWIQYAATNGEMVFRNYASGSWEDSLKLIGNGGVELYYDNTKQFSTSANGAYTESGIGLRCGSSGPVSQEIFTVQRNSGQIAYFDHSGSDDHSVLQVRHRGATGSTYRTHMAILDDAADQVGSIKGHGSATQFNTASDYRLKENEVLISDGITRLKTLKPYRFNFKKDPATTVDGFFAHEVTAVPEAIAGEKDGKEMQGLDYAKLTPLLTAALQEAITKIETLETEVNTLKTKVAALEAA